MLAYITGTVDQELLLRNEYLATENRILKAQLKGRLLLTEGRSGWLGLTPQWTFTSYPLPACPGALRSWLDAVVGSRLVLCQKDRHLEPGRAGHEARCVGHDPVVVLDRRHQPFPHVNDQQKRGVAPD